MSVEQINPFDSPAPIVHGYSPKHGFALIAFGVCGLVSIGVFSAQLIARSYFADYGVALPILTHWALNPIFACLPLFWLPFVLASRSWENRWGRLLVCATSILFAIFCVAFFTLAIYLPIVAIRNGLGLP